MDAILVAARVTKGALYHHFDNKEALGYAVVDEVIASNTREKWLRPLRNAENPIDVLTDIVRATSFRTEDLECGCPLLNLSQEMSPLNEGFRTRTAKIFKDWHDAIAAALTRGQKVGLVRSDLDSDETATFFIAAHEGFISLGKNSRDIRVLHAGQKSVIRFLESLRGRRGRSKRSKMAVSTIV